MRRSAKICHVSRANVDQMVREVRGRDLEMTRTGDVAVLRAEPNEVYVYRLERIVSADDRDVEIELLGGGTQ